MLPAYRIATDVVPNGRIIIFAHKGAPVDPNVLRELNPAEEEIRFITEDGCPGPSDHDRSYRARRQANRTPTSRKKYGVLALFTGCLLATGLVFVRFPSTVPRWRVKVIGADCKPAVGVRVAESWSFRHGALDIDQKVTSEDGTAVFAERSTRI